MFVWTGCVDRLMQPGPDWVRMQLLVAYIQYTNCGHLQLSRAIRPRPGVGGQNWTGSTRRETPRKFATYFHCPSILSVGPR